MNLENLLTNEAVSNYIIFLAGLVIGFIVFLIRTYIYRTKPKLLKFISRNQTSVFDVNPKVRSDLEVKYKTILIESLYLSTFTLHNTSDETLCATMGETTSLKRLE